MSTAGSVLKVPPPGVVLSSSSRGSQRFRDDRNDFSPFNTLGELNSATSQMRQPSHPASLRSHQSGFNTPFQPFHSAARSVHSIGSGPNPPFHQPIHFGTDTPYHQPVHSGTGTPFHPSHSGVNTPLRHPSQSGVNTPTPSHHPGQAGANTPFLQGVRPGSLHTTVANATPHMPERTRSPSIMQPEVQYVPLNQDDLARRGSMFRPEHEIDGMPILQQVSSQHGYPQLSGQPSNRDSDIYAPESEYPPASKEQYDQALQRARSRESYASTAYQQPPPGIAPSYQPTLRRAGSNYSAVYETRGGSDAMLNHNVPEFPEIIRPLTPEEHYEQLEKKPSISHAVQRQPSTTPRPTPRPKKSRSVRETIVSFSNVQPQGLQFEREGDDLIVRVLLPWTERLNETPCKFHITGVDGIKYKLEIDYRWTKMIQGTAKFYGAGWRARKGMMRGNLIIEWEIVFFEDSASGDDDSNDSHY